MMYICMHAQKKTIWGYRRFNHFSYAHIVDVLLVQKISMSLYYRQGSILKIKFYIYIVFVFLILQRSTFNCLFDVIHVYNKVTITSRFEGS